MSEDGKGLNLFWRLVWALVAGGLVFVGLSYSGLELGVPVVIGASVGAGVLAGIVGPVVVDLVGGLF